jgi:hypothetical protein
MFDALATAISGLPALSSGEAVAQLAAQRDRLDARLAQAIGELDASGLWGLDGSVSCAA